MTKAKCPSRIPGFRCTKEYGHMTRCGCTKTADGGAILLKINWTITSAKKHVRTQEGK